MDAKRLQQTRLQYISQHHSDVFRSLYLSQVLLHRNWLKYFINYYKKIQKDIKQIKKHHKWSKPLNEGVPYQAAKTTKKRAEIAHGAALGSCSSLGVTGSSSRPAVFKIHQKMTVGCIKVWRYDRYLFVQKNIDLWKYLKIFKSFFRSVLALFVFESVCPCSSSWLVPWLDFISIFVSV